MNLGDAEEDGTTAKIERPYEERKLNTEFEYFEGDLGGDLLGRRVTGSLNIHAFFLFKFEYFRR